MAYFRCGQGAGTSLTIQITTSSSALYGQTITISKNGSTVGTTTFDNSGEAEYTVDESGTYTVSATLAGTAYTDTVDVTDTFDAEINPIPDGSTVTPVNDIQIWLHCGNVWDKNYTTLAAVLADSTTLLALISSQNAVDYMVRSHDWCADVCADSTAMTYIGANNYASDTLLADSGTGNWLESICNSAYFESVLNVKVPTMTSNTTPSGECFGNNGSTTGDYAPYKAFDKSDSTYFSSTANPVYVGYDFQSDVLIKKVHVRCTAGSGTPTSPATFTVQSYVNGSWQDIDVTFDVVKSVEKEYSIIATANTQKAQKYRAFRNGAGGVVNQWGYIIYEIQFYGRTDV